MSTCSGLAALDHANSKFSRGYATTGVGVGMCARHEFIQKNGVGDLQKGERYVRCTLLRSSPSFFIGTAIWTISLRRSSATIATNSPRLDHTTLYANGQYTSSNASNVFQFLSACASSSLLHSLSRSCISTATNANVSLIIHFTFTRVLVTPMERASSGHTRSSAPWEQQRGRWARVQGTTR